MGTALTYAAPTTVQTVSAAAPFVTTVGAAPAVQQILPAQTVTMAPLAFQQAMPAQTVTMAPTIQPFAPVVQETVLAAP